MRNLIKIIIVVLYLFVSWCNPATAFTTDIYASASKFSSGKWVKVSVDKSGITEIPYSQLRELGFSNPEKVGVYGRGGAQLPEILSNTLPDDIQPVGVQHIGDKLIFYAVNASPATYTYDEEQVRGYVVNNNPYSQLGYYFLTDSQPVSLVTEATGSSLVVTAADSTSMCYAHHEENIINIGKMGRIFLGEDFLSSGEMSIPFTLSGRVPGTQISVGLGAGYFGDTTIKLQLSVNGESCKSPIASLRLIKKYDSYDEYSYNTLLGTHTISASAESTDASNVTLTVKTTVPSDATILRLDYATISYRHTNTLTDGASQCYMGIADGERTLSITSDDDNIRVWNVTQSQSPVMIPVVSKPELGKFRYFFSSEKSSTSDDAGTEMAFVAFNPNRELNRVTPVGDISNQNLHAITDADMLIIACDEFMEQAERLAQFHRDYDGYKVAVASHSAVVNEFSQGVPDVMAYRRLAKMIYDRNAARLRFILLFGGGNFNNANVGVNNTTPQLLTYQSADGTNDANNYCTDDFFALLDDDSGADVLGEKLSVAIGRFPVKSVDDATLMVDKYINYVTETKLNGSYRNNEVLLFADEGDNELHATQAETLSRYINGEYGSAAHVGKMYVPQLQCISSGESPEGKKQLHEWLKQGEAFVGFFGHASASVLTKYAHLLSVNDVSSLSGNMPALYVASTCSASRFDGDAKNICSQLNLHPTAGAIATMAAVRTVYARENYVLCEAFARKLFTNADITIGEALQQAKNESTGSALNRANYVLLGNPALKMRLKKGTITLSSINGTAPSNATIAPLQKVSIKGEIPGGEKAQGMVSAAIYNAKKLYFTLTEQFDGQNEPTYSSPELLATFTAPVTDGKFEITGTMPNCYVADGKNPELYIYAIDSIAKKDYATQCATISFVSTPASSSDTESTPQIEDIYLNSTDFTQGSTLTGDVTLYAVITDESGLEHSYPAVGGGIAVEIDGKRSDIYSAGTLSLNNDATRAEISAQLSDIDAGVHTATVRARNVCGNSVERTITFVYGAEDTIKPDIALSTTVATESVTLSLTGIDENDIADVAYYFLNSNSEAVAHIASASVGITWNLKDNDGESLASGAYDCYAIVTTPTGAKHSTPRKKIVIDKQ